MATSGSEPSFIAVLFHIQISVAAESLRERSAAALAQRRLVRHRRNISWYKEHSDFWGWYKFFTENNNQEAVSGPVLRQGVSQMKHNQEYNKNLNGHMTIIMSHFHSCSFHYLPAWALNCLLASVCVCVFCAGLVKVV